MTRTFKRLGDERSLQRTPIAIRLVDVFTGETPIGGTRLALKRESGEPMGRTQPTRTQDGVYCYPNLGLTADTLASPRDYQITIESDYYLATTTDAFPVHPHNSTDPLSPGEFATSVQQVDLIPNARYPYPSHVALIHGRLIAETDHSPIGGTRVSYRGHETLSSRNGDFMLPVPFPAVDTITSAVSAVNSVEVQEAGGFFQAVIKVAGVGNDFRVTEIRRLGDEDVLIVSPLSGPDLPAGIEIGSNVSLRSFAIRVGSNHHHDVPAATAFTKFLTIPISTTP